MFELRQGDSLRLAGKLTYRSGDPPTPQPLTGVTSVVTIRALKADGSLGAVAPGAAPVLEWLDTAGTYQIIVDEAVTVLWKPGSYVLEIELTFPGADPTVITMPEEEFTVTRKVKP